MTQPLHDHWQRLCRALLPHGLETQGPDARRRAELALALIALATPIALVRIVTLFVGGVVTEALLGLGGLVLLHGLVLLFRRTRSLFLLGNGVALMFFGLMSSVAHLRGVGSPAAIALALTPLFATFIVGWRAGLFWAVAAVAEVALVALVWPDRYPAGSQALLDLISVAALSALVMITGLAYEMSKNAALAALRQAENERQRAWEEARMLRADRMASLGQLAASVAHEINTPLTYVNANLAFVESRLAMLEEASLGPERGDLLDALAEAHSGALRVAEIVRDLKSFVRPDEDEVALLDLRAVMDKAARMADAEVRQHARLVKDYAPVPPVQGNDVRMTQVFVNLLINAAQAIPADSGGEHVITAVVALAPGGVLIEVRDTGVGIPADILPRVTEPFFTTKAVGVGTGLGLAVCKTIVERYQGTLEIDSEQGKGTVVRVLLPAADVSAGASADLTAETTADMGGETTVEMTMDIGAETTAETTADTSAQTRADTSPETRADTSPETTADVSAETTAETTADVSAETTADTSAETTAETTADTSAETTAETTADASAETSAETTAETSAETTADVSAETTAETSAETVAGGEADGPHAPRRRNVTVEVAEALRILVVDDDQALMRSLRRALRTHRLVCVGSGQEALAHLQADHAFDAVLCDLLMPGMTGIELYDRLEALGLAVRERMLFFTGDASTPRVRSFLSRFPNRAVEKPIAPERLEAAIAAVAAAADRSSDSASDCAAQ